MSLISCLNNNDYLYSSLNSRSNSIEDLYSEPLTPNENSLSLRRKSSSLVTYFEEMETFAFANPNWHNRVVTVIDNYKFLLEAKIPNHFIQKKLDSLGRGIHAKFAKLDRFNNWLNSNGQSDWYKQLATFLIKLPARAVRNVVQLLYHVVAASLRTVTHPLKTLLDFASTLVHIIHGLTQSGTWTRMGAGVIGGSLGQALVTGNFYGLIGIAVGGAMMLGGLSASAIDIAIKKLKNDREGKLAAKVDLYLQLKQIPESMLTGFIVGLTLGAVTKVVNGKQTPLKLT